MPNKTQNPNHLLTKMRNLVEEAKTEAEHGIEKPDRFYEAVEKTMAALDEACSRGDLPDSWKSKEIAAVKVLVDGLKYHEHDGHDMPKRVAREALEALGVPPDEQP